MAAMPSLMSDRPAHARQAIVFCADANYLPFAAHAAAQIAALHPLRDFDICIADATEVTLPESLAPLGLRRITLAPGDIFDRFDRDARRNQSTYFRLLLPDLLGDDYRSILYLDADIHVENGDFSALLRTNLAGRPLAAIRDNPQWRTPGRQANDLKALGLGNVRYFNAGVLLMDTLQWRAAEILPRALDFGARHAGRLQRNDQTLLNGVLMGDWAELSPVWNWQYSKRAQLFEAMTGANIVHFIGPTKPWNAPAGQLPPRFGRDLARFLQTHFPERRIEVPAGPRPDQMGKMLVRHFLSRGRMARYLARFPTETTVHA